MKKLVILSTLLILISYPTFGANKYVCQVSFKKVCSEKGCKDAKILGDDYRIIDVSAKTYIIGDQKFKLEGISSSGIFKYFYVGGAGFMKMVEMGQSIKDLIEIKRGEFIEVRDTFLSTITSWGICKF